MPLSSTPYTLTAQQLDAAVAALAKATETFRLSWYEGCLYRVMQICGATSGVAIVATPGLIMMRVSDETLSVVAGIGALAAAAALFLLLINLRLIWKARRQGKMLKQLGLQDISDSAWKVHRRKRRVSRTGGWIVFALGIVLMLSGSRAVKEPEFISGAFFAVLGSLILLWRTVKQSRERLSLVADAERLRDTLSSLQGNSEEGIVVPADLLEKVASIEQAHIARERTSAVLAGASAAKHGYGILLAREASEKKASLPPDLRIDVEELIEELAAVGQHRTGVQNARTPDGTAEIDYSVDQSNRRLNIVAIRTSDSHGH